MILKHDRNKSTNFARLICRKKITSNIYNNNNKNIYKIRMKIYYAKIVILFRTINEFQARKIPEEISILKTK